MRAGPLRDRVEILEQRTTRDAGGAATTTYVPVATVWGRVEPLSGRERILAGGTGAVVSGRITLRYYHGLSPRHRLAVTTRNTRRVFGITAALNPDARLIQHVCDVVEVV